MDTMSNSAGSAEAEMSTIAESLEYKLNALKETGTGVFQNLFKKEDFSAVIDGLTSILQVIDTVTEQLGLFKTIGLGVGLTAFIKNLKQLKGLGSLALDLGGLRNAKEFFAVTNSLKSFTVESIAARVATTSLSNEQKIAAVQNAVLAATNKVVTTSEAEEALAAAAAATSTTAAGAAATGASVGFGALGASVKAAAAGLGTFLVTNPVGWAILAATAIAGTVKIVDALTESFEEAQDKAAESREAYQSTTSEIEQLNSELETTQNRISELKAQGALSVTDKAELAELQAQNKQLQEQIEIKKKIAGIQGHKAAEDADNVLTKKTQSATEWIDDRFDQSGNSSNDARDIIERTKEKQQSLNQYTADYNKLLEEQSKLEPEYSKWWEADTQYEKNEKQLEGYKSQMDTLTAEIAENLDTINTEYTTLFDSDGNVLSGFEDTAQRCEELFDYTLSSTDKAAQTSEKIDSIFNKPTLSGFKDELLKIAENSDNAGITADDVKNKYSELADACEDAQVDIQDLVDYINSTAGIIDVDEVKSQLSEAFDVSDEKEKFDAFLESKSADELKILYSLYESNDTSGWTIEDFQSAMDELQTETVTVQVDVDMKDSQSIVSEIQSLQSALNSQSTGSSIPLETFNSEELADYQSALEYVNGSMQLNADKAREIAKAKVEEQTATNNANKELRQAQYMQNINQIEEYKRQLKDKNNLTAEEVSEMQKKISACQTDNAEILAECDQLDVLNASLKESISIYNEWKNAQNASESGDMFDDTLTAIKTINDTLNNSESENYGRVGRKDFETSVDLIIPDSVNPENEQAINKYMDSIKKFFTFDENGERNGLNIEEFCQQAVDKGLMILDKAGKSYEVAGGKTMADFANGMNLSMPLIQAMFGELEEFGGEFDWGDEMFSTFGDGIVAAQREISDLKTEIKSLKKQKDAGIDIDTSKLDEANAKLKKLKKQKEELTQKATVNIESNIELDKKLKKANEELTICQAKYDNLDKNADKQYKIEVKTNLDNAKAEVDKLQKKKDKLQEPTTVEVQASLGNINSELAEIKNKIDIINNDQISVEPKLSKSEADAALKELENQKTALENKKVKIQTYADTKKSVDDLTTLDKKEIEDKKFDVTAIDKATSVINRIKNSMSTLDDKHVTITTTEKKQTIIEKAINEITNGKKKVNGTAHVSGTAKVSGDWGNKEPGTTLVGELGREIVVLKSHLI